MDWYFLHGRPYAMRLATGLFGPGRRGLGADFAGTVEAVGGRVTGFKPGDDVFGARIASSFAEVLCVSESRVAPKPANASFEEAAALPVAGLTALQALRDQARLRPGQRVLVNGSTGGVGTFAVQIAKAMGAEVTPVCRTPNVGLVRSLGADHVVDYTREDFTRGDRRYDVMVDVAGSRPWSECVRVLAPDATVVIAGGPRRNPWVGPLAQMIGMRLGAIGGRRRVRMFVATSTRADLLALRDLAESGKIRPAIDRRYPLDRIADALSYLGEGHARAKVVVTI
jgi:NADPH:quinone reductase-like Zn-dependent oxidoreductase